MFLFLLIVKMVYPDLMFVLNLMFMFCGVPMNYQLEFLVVVKMNINSHNVVFNSINDRFSLVQSTLVLKIISHCGKISTIQVI